MHFKVFGLGSLVVIMLHLSVASLPVAAGGYQEEVDGFTTLTWYVKFTGKRENGPSDNMSISFTEAYDLRMQKVSTGEGLIYYSFSSPNWNDNINNADHLVEIHSFSYTEYSYIGGWQKDQCSGLACIGYSDDPRLAVVQTFLESGSGASHSESVQIISPFIFLTDFAGDDFYRDMFSFFVASGHDGFVPIDTRACYEKGCNHSFKTTYEGENSDETWEIKLDMSVTPKERLDVPDRPEIDHTLVGITTWLLIKGNRR